MLSLIIPVLNEEKTISACLDNLSALSGNFEVVFADGGSTDKTVELIGSRHKVIPCPRGRAKQMNHAAAQCQGDILFFSHCDSRLPADAVQQVCQAVEKGAHWGCFHISFDLKHPFMTICTFQSNRRVWMNGTAFGDQGMFFTRGVFEEVGGWPDLPIMEDYEMSLKLRGKYRPVLLPGRILTSARRYRDGGMLPTMWKMFRLRCMYRRGEDINEIARLYRDIR